MCVQLNQYDYCAKWSSAWWDNFVSETVTEEEWQKKYLHELNIALQNN